MKKYRKWLIAVLIVFVIATLSTISYRGIVNDLYAVNDYYQIFREDGKFYMLLTNYGATFAPRYHYQFDDTGKRPEFTSVAEMKERFITGDFTEEEIKCIAYGFSPLQPKPCINFDNLYDAQLPEGGTVSRVVWAGENYYIYFSYPGCSAKDAGSITSTHSSDFRHYSEYVNAEYYRGSYTYIKQVDVPARNAIAHYYHNSEDNRDYVDLWYELKNSEKAAYVTETYIATSYESGRVPPKIIQLTVKQGDVYYRTTFYNLRATPTEDWLLSFGLKPYVAQE